MSHDISGIATLSDNDDRQSAQRRRERPSSTPRYAPQQELSEDEESAVHKRPKNKTPVNGRSVAKNRKHPNPDNQLQNLSDEGQALTETRRKQQPSEPGRRQPNKIGRAPPLQSDESDENPPPKKRRTHKQKSALSPSRPQVVHVQDEEDNEEELFNTQPTPSLQKKKQRRVHSPEPEPVATTLKKNKKRKQVEE